MSDKLSFAQLKEMAEACDVKNTEGYGFMPIDFNKLTFKEENGKLYVRCSLNNSIWWAEIDKEEKKNNIIKFIY